MIQYQVKLVTITAMCHVLSASKHYIYVIFGLDGTVGSEDVMLQQSIIFNLTLEMLTVL